MKTPPDRRRGGYALMELFVVLALLGVFMLGAAAFFMHAMSLSQAAAALEFLALGRERQR